MKRAVLYARVSSDKQAKERTIESQIAGLKKQIERAGDVLIKEYIDDGHSGAKLDRPGLNELRDDLKKGVFDIIYVWSTDRIARDAMYLNIIITEILVKKKQLIINGKDYINNPENKFELTILGAVAELERAKILERNYRGKMHRLKQGHLVGHGCHLYGYHYHPRTVNEPARLEINEEQAEVVKFIFETYAKGNISIATIVKKLKDQGVTNIKDWKIRYMLKNHTYTGVKYFNTMTEKKGSRVIIPKDKSEWIGVKVPAIVSKEIFDEVQKKLAFNHKCYRNAKGTQLLSNLIYCSKCQKRCSSYRKFYSVQRLKGLTTYHNRYYHCATKGKGHNPAIDVRFLEYCINEIFTETIYRPDKLIKHLSVVKQKRRKSGKIQKELEAISTRLKKLSEQRERIVDLYATGDIEQTEYYEQMIKIETETETLTSEKSTLLHQLPLLEQKEAVQFSVKEYCADIQKRHKARMDFNAKRDFYLDTIDKVEYNKSLKTALHIKLHGSVPVSVKIGGKEEVVKVPYAIKKTLTAMEANILMLELDYKDRTMWGKPISHAKFNALNDKS